MKNIEWSQSSSSAACALILCLVKFFGNVKRNHISKRISREAERIVVWQHWLIRLIRQPFQTDCKNIRKRTKKWENESSGRVVISFGVTANKSKQMSHVHLWNTRTRPGPKEGTDRELGPAVLLQQEEAAGTLSSVCQKESVRAIPSWLHSRVTSLFSALLPCKYAGEVSSVWWCFCTWTSLLFDRAWRPVFATHYHRFTA